MRSALATGGSVFFTAVAASQKSLFSYDSTNVVAASVNTIVSFGATDSISQLVDVGEKLFFVQGGSNFLYVYNGINTTQAKVVDANNVTGFENVLFADQLTRVGTSKLFLSAQNSTSWKRIISVRYKQLCNCQHRQLECFIDYNYNLSAARFGE